MLRLTIPWPPPELSPNRSVHWAVLARAKKIYRMECMHLAKAQGAKPIKADRLDVKFIFYPPNKRKIDLDNCIAKIKAGIDGIADAIGVDDSKWRMTFELSPEIKGVVQVIISQ